MATNKSAVFTFGRFNPISSGHEKLINRVLSLAKSQKNTDAHVFTSYSYDPKKNPLKFEQKVFWLKKAFPGVTVSSNKKIIDPFKAVEELAKKYDHITMVIGGDRIGEFESKLERWFYKEYPEKTIDFANAGERAALQVNGEDVSGSFLRKYATKNDYSTFEKAIPSKLRGEAGKKLFSQVRAGMGLK